MASIIPESDPITIIDVGARWGASDYWKALPGRFKVYGFDPDEKECIRLNSMGNSPAEYFPVAIGPKRMISELYITNEPACSSIYAPRTEIVESIPALRSNLAVEAKTEIELISLDEWCCQNNISRVDVLKIDTQGSELGVLQGSVETLKNVLWIEVEVEFNPLYAGQPLFSDVDSFLREQGFVLWRFGELVHYGDGSQCLDGGKPMTVDFEYARTSVPVEGGQLFWGQAYYMRSDLAFTSGVKTPERERTRLACIAYAAGFFDAAVSVDPGGPVAQLIHSADRLLAANQLSLDYAHWLDRARAQDEQLERAATRLAELDAQLKEQDSQLRAAAELAARLDSQLKEQDIELRTAATRLAELDARLKNETA